jgi:hypothetical protein
MLHAGRLVHPHVVIADVVVSSSLFVGPSPSASIASHHREAILINARCRRPARRMRAASTASAVAPCTAAPPRGRRIDRRRRDRRNRRRAGRAWLPRRRRGGTGAWHTVRRRRAACAQTSGAPGKLRPEAAGAHWPRRERAAAGCWGPCLLTAALQAAAAPCKVRIKTAGRAGPVTVAGLRPRLTTDCRLRSSSFCAKVGRRRLGATAAQRL